MPHQYIDRESRRIQTEKLFGNAAIRFLYSGVREQTPWLFRKLISARASRILGGLNYGGMFSEKVAGRLGICTAWGIDLRECLDPPARLDTFSGSSSARSATGSAGRRRTTRMPSFRPPMRGCSAVPFAKPPASSSKGNFSTSRNCSASTRKTGSRPFTTVILPIFRLTPDKYHYNHSPVAGKVIDFYPIPGLYHACNPNAVVSVATPYSKNKRVVTDHRHRCPGGNPGRTGGHDRSRGPDDRRYRPVLQRKEIRQPPAGRVGDVHPAGSAQEPLSPRQQHRRARLSKATASALRTISLQTWLITGWKASSAGTSASPLWNRM